MYRVRLRDDHASIDYSKQMLRQLMDQILDRSVIGGYTRAGFSMRSRWFEQLPANALAGRNVVVTGATSGIGRAAALGLAKLQARLILVGRDQTRGEEACDSAREQGARASFLSCDLDEPGAVLELAERIKNQYDRVDVLINNAGLMAAERALDSRGLEMSFAVNTLAGFVLTAALSSQFADSRVINVSSGGAYLSDAAIDDLQYETGVFDGVTAYARTKRQQIFLSALWARALKDRALVFAMHPGWVDTPAVRNSLPRFYKITGPLLRSPEEGADTTVWLSATSRKLESGAFYCDREQRPMHRVGWTKNSAADLRRLWYSCERHGGVQPQHRPTDEDFEAVAKME